jgi:predicted transcriptional regulator
MRINDVLRERNISKAQAARLANIPQNDFYQATNGKRSFFPAWRKRLSEVLNMSEDELFPEYKKEG